MANFSLMVAYEGPRAESRVHLGDISIEEAEEARDSLLRERRKAEVGWEARNVFVSRRIVSCEVLAE